MTNTNRAELLKTARQIIDGEIYISGEAAKSALRFVDERITCEEFARIIGR